MKEVWRIWKYSLGSFNDSTTKKYDNQIVIVRSIIFISYLITNCFITAGVIRHWGDSQQTVTLSPDSLVGGAIISTSEEIYDS